MHSALAVYSAGRDAKLYGEETNQRQVAVPMQKVVLLQAPTGSKGQHGVRQLRGAAC